MNASVLREKSTEELSAELLALLKEQFNLSLQKGTGQTANKPHLLKNVRLRIARVKTVLREKGSKV